MSRTSWTAAWSVEKSDREERLDRLPGKQHHERFETLNRASELFSGNLLEFKNHLGKFLDTDVQASELPKWYESETIRLFHNYLASVATLKDMQRATHKVVWPERLPPEERSDPKDQRTVWEAAVYGDKTKEVFGDDDLQFLFDLRNCTLHRTVPLMVIGTTWKHHPPEPVMQRNSVMLKRSELAKFNRWNGPAKRFLKTQDGDVDFLPLVEKHSQRAREFFGWFWQQVKDAVRLDVDEYLDKQTELALWLREETVTPDFGDGWGDGPIPGSLRRKRAEAHAHRSAHGTAGWRQVEVGSDGTVVVGETDWPPLPAVGKYRIKEA